MAITSPSLMNGVMLLPRAWNRNDAPLPSTSFASRVKTAMGNRLPSSSVENTLPGFLGPSVAIGSQSMIPTRSRQSRVAPLVHLTLPLVSSRIRAMPKPNPTLTNPR